MRSATSRESPSTSVSFANGSTATRERARQRRALQDVLAAAFHQLLRRRGHELGGVGVAGVLLERLLGLVVGLARVALCELLLALLGQLFRAGAGGEREQQGEGEGEASAGTSHRASMLAGGWKGSPAAT